MKKICLISTYCDTEEKKQILTKNIQKIKSINLDVMIFTPISLPNEIYDLCDYVIISKENPVFDWPLKAYGLWKKFLVDDCEVFMSTTFRDYGYANLNQYKRMGEFAIKYNYDHFFFMIYDVVITDDVIRILQEEENNLFYKSGRNDQVWNLGLHLISLDKTKIIEFTNLINQEDYLSDSTDDAFSFIVKKNSQLDMEISDIVIYDDVDLFTNENIWEKKLNKDISYFIHRNDEDSFIKLVFYGFPDELEVEVQYNNFIKFFSVKEYDEIEIKEKNFDWFKIKVQENYYEISNVINNIKWNSFEKNCN
jgi:hypothetical protein